MKKLQKLLRASLLSNLFFAVVLSRLWPSSPVIPPNHFPRTEPQKRLPLAIYSADASSPFLRIKSGDTVEVHTLITSSDPEKLEACRSSARTGRAVPSATFSRKLKTGARGDTY